MRSVRAIGQSDPGEQPGKNAEAVKLFCNVQRDIIFALSNQFALTSEALGLDISDIERAASAGYSCFQLSRPGPVAGPCLPKDVRLLDHSVPPGSRVPELALAGRALNLSALVT